MFAPLRLQLGALCEHRIAERKESVSTGDRGVIGRARPFVSNERGDQHQ